MTDFRIGHGYDVHELAEGLPLIIGGVTIPHEKGCVAHSDGDVLVHALCDALLGAAAMGDIGKHFPDNSDEFKGIDSMVFLDRIAGRLVAEGYFIGNIDCTLALQRPKVGSYIEAMRRRIAEVTDVPMGRISVKATTTERLGFVGREEGIEAHAVVLIYKKA